LQGIVRALGNLAGKTEKHAQGARQNAGIPLLGRLSHFKPSHFGPSAIVDAMAEVQRLEETIANGVRAGAIVSTLSQAVQERERYNSVVRPIGSRDFTTSASTVEVNNVSNLIVLVVCRPLLASR